MMRNRFLIVASAVAASALLGSGIGIHGMPSGLAGMGGPKPASTDAVTLDAWPHVYARV